MGYFLLQTSINKNSKLPLIFPINMLLMIKLCKGLLGCHIARKPVFVQAKLEAPSCNMYESKQAANNADQV